MRNAWARPSGRGCSAYSKRRPHCWPVPEQLAEARQVLRRGDDQDIPDAREHQRAQRVVDHRLVVDREQLLADHAGQRVEPRARAAGEDDALQSSSLRLGAELLQRGAQPERSSLQRAERLVDAEPAPGRARAGHPRVGELDGHEQPAIEAEHVHQSFPELHPVDHLGAGHVPDARESPLGQLGELLGHVQGEARRHVLIDEQPARPSPPAAFPAASSRSWAAARAGSRRRPRCARWPRYRRAAERPPPRATWSARTPRRDLAELPRRTGRPGRRTRSRSRRGPGGRRSRVPGARRGQPRERWRPRQRRGSARRRRPRSSRRCGQ